MDTSTENNIENSEWYVSSEDEDAENNTSSNSVFEDENSVSHELIRIFNLTPPLNDKSFTQPNVIVPYYITVYNPIPDKHDNLGIIQGSIMYNELLSKFKTEILQILLIYVQRIGRTLWKKRNPPTFDDFLHLYYVEPYTRNCPFVIHYFLNEEWRIFKYTSEFKQEVYTQFLGTIHKL